MTDPRGRSFLSYRRTRKHEAELLIAAQHDVGIPTWQDIRNLDEEHTETEIRKVLSDPATANAILWLTPEVAHSAVIRNVEVHLIFTRLNVRDYFFIVPVAAGGLDYDKAAQVLNPAMQLEDLKQWNLRKVTADPIGPSDATDIARRVLSRRLKAIHQCLPPDEKLYLQFYTRGAAPYNANAALVLDWTHRFNGREATSVAWDDHLLPALRLVAEAIQTYAPGRLIEVSGQPAVPAAIALGCVCLATGGLSVAWLQKTRGSEDQLWNIEVQAEDSGFEAITRGADTSATDLAVLVSVADNVEPAFAASQPTLPSFRAITKVSKGNGGRHRVATPGGAIDIARVIIDGIRQARQEFQFNGRIHLFMAVPVGLAMMVGQLLNTLGPVQTYEHISDGAVGCYHPAALLTPSS